jgi:hypothetical protein
VVYNIQEIGWFDPYEEYLNWIEKEKELAKKPRKK